jgi:hypothetical protein
VVRSFPLLVPLSTIGDKLDFSAHWARRAIAHILSSCRNRKSVQSGSGCRNLVLKWITESIGLAGVEIVSLEIVAATKSGYRIQESGTHS